MEENRKEIPEYVAEYLRGLGIPCVSGSMPHEPDRVVAVYATGVRARRDEEGSRFQVIVRSERDVDTAIGDAMRVIDMLDEFEGILTVDSPYFQRIVLESGAANLGKDGNNRLSYSVNFRAYYC